MARSRCRRDDDCPGGAAVGLQVGDEGIGNVPARRPRFVLVGLGAPTERDFTDFSSIAFCLSRHIGFAPCADG
jgi:hypothetical protein